MQKLQKQPRRCESSQNVNIIWNLYRDVTLCFLTRPSVNNLKDSKLRTAEQPLQIWWLRSAALITGCDSVSQSLTESGKVGSLVWREERNAAFWCEMMSFKQSFSSLNGGKNASCKTKDPGRLETNLCIAESGLWRTIKHNSKNQMRFALQTVPLFKIVLGSEFCVTFPSFVLLFCASDNPVGDLTEPACSEVKARPYGPYMIRIDSFVFDMLSVKGITFMWVVTVCGTSSGRLADPSNLDTSTRHWENTHAHI